jgi:hypothetical protein
MAFENELKTFASGARIYIPSSSSFRSLESVFAATTHLVVAPHADDDALMGAEAICEADSFPDRHLTAVIASASPGTGRPAGYEGRSSEDMSEIRYQEQCAAAETGRYAATIQLGFTSEQVKNMEMPKRVEPLTETRRIIGSLKFVLDHAPHAQTVYVPCLFDHNETHHALAILALEAIRMMEPDRRPQNCYGPEVSPGINWIGREYMARLSVANMPLVKSVLKNYRTELAKRKYDDGLEGRAVANDVFNRPEPSTGRPFIWAVDYGRIVRASEDMSVIDAVESLKTEILADHMRRQMRRENLDIYRSNNAVLEKLQKA